MTLPPVVIDAGSCTTRAGFALEDLPLVVFSSKYAVGSDNEPIFADEEISQNPHLEVMSASESAGVYAPEYTAKSWHHVFSQLDNASGIDARDQALMVTEQLWASPKYRAHTAQVAFEEFGVPLFSLVKTPLAQLYHMGRASGLVIDVGSAATTVTPVLDGVVQAKLSFQSKYAGDFLDLHCLRSIEAKFGAESDKLDLSLLLPQKYQPGSALGNLVSDSFKRYWISRHVISSFKQTMLTTSEVPPGMPASNAYYPQPVRPHPTLFQLSNKSHVPFSDAELQALSEPLFVPHAYPLAGLTLPEPAFNKAATHGVSNLALFSIKNLESTFLSGAGNDVQGAGASARFNEVLRQLFSNTLVTGGGSLIPGFADRVCGDLSRTAPQLLPGYVVTNSYKLYVSPMRNHNTGTIHDTLDKKFGAWIGAANLALMLSDNDDGSGAGSAGSAGIALDNWFVSKADYEELGEDLIVEKFK